VGASQLAKAVGQMTLMLTDTQPSQASQLLQDGGMSDNLMFLSLRHREQARSHSGELWCS